MFLVLFELTKFMNKYKNQITLAFTISQHSQLLLVKTTLWMMESKLDLDDLECLIGSMPVGFQGTTGTQAEFLELFDGITGDAAV